jgi:hypothetical protein
MVRLKHKPHAILDAHLMPLLSALPFNHRQYRETPEETPHASPQVVAGSLSF